MAELDDELRTLAHQVAAIEHPDVVDSAAMIAALCRKERIVAFGLSAVDSILNDGPQVIEQTDPRMVAVKEKMRDRLKGLLAWARETGRA